VANHLAIATITATLQRMLQESVQMDVEGARVTTIRPSDIGNGTPETGVNLFMYQVVSNPALNNIDATPARSRGNPIRRQAALDLYYMLSFYGNDSELAPQRMLGSVVRTLNDRQIVTADMLQATCLDSRFSFLRDSTLAEQVQQITVLPMDFNLEDLSKAWSVFFQTTYVLSMAYKVLVVMVDGQETSTRALPIRQRSNGISPFWITPQIDRVVAQAGIYEPILAGSTLAIRGRHLKGLDRTQVRICEQEVLPMQVSDTEIILPLDLVSAAHLRAGMQSLQVIHSPRIEPNSDSSGRQRGVESNAIPFVLRPQVTTVNLLATDEVDDDVYNGVLEVEINLAIGTSQRVVVSLNEWTVGSSVSYLFEAERRSQVTQTVRIPMENVKAGEYLVRLLVDGAESQLVVDNDPNSETYEWFVGPRIAVGTAV
jgi:Pvc16 N-terminal domain